MTTTRDDTLVLCRIGSLEFPAISASGGETERRIAAHGAIGMDGQFTEDLGEDARRDTLNAVLTEEQWLKLDRIRRAGKVVDIVHPLFGSYRGRVVSCPYEAGEMDHVDVSITLIEEGEHRQYTIQPSLAQSAQAAQNALYDVLAASTELYEALGSDGADFIASANLVAEAAFASYGAFLDDILEGAEKTWGEAGAAFDAFAESMGAVVEVVDTLSSATAITESASALVDACYASIAAARAVVDSVGSEITDMWTSLDVPIDRTIDSILEEHFGEVSEEYLDTLLSSNPELIDLVAVPAGVSLRLPVLR